MADQEDYNPEAMDPGTQDLKAIGNPNVHDTRGASHTKLRYIRFKCVKCSAEDKGKFYEGEPVPPVINCWNCHAGLQHPQGIEGMVRDRLGMFRAGEEDADGNPIQAQHKTVQ